MKRILLAPGLLSGVLLLAGCAAKPAPAPVLLPSRPATVPIPAAPPRVEPPNFTGLTADALTARLGKPQFTRKDGPTDMWRYDNKDCHAFFFFSGGQVNHVETIPRPNDQATDPACLTSLRKTS